MCYISVIPESFWRYRLVYRDGEVEEEPNITHIQEQSDSAAKAASQVWSQSSLYPEELASEMLVYLAVLYSSLTPACVGRDEQIPDGLQQRFQGQNGSSSWLEGAVCAVLFGPGDHNASAPAAADDDAAPPARISL